MSFEGISAPGDYVDRALAAIGGEDTEFYLDGCQGASNVPHAVRLTCRYRGCEWGLFVGEMELWEFVVDAREHWENEHTGTLAPSEVPAVP